MPVRYSWSASAYQVSYMIFIADGMSQSAIHYTK